MLQLGRAADHGRLDAFDAAGGGPESAGLAPDQVDAQRLGLALDLEWRQRLDIEQAAHVAVGVVGDQDAADGRRVLEPAGDIDGIAHGRELSRGADVADQDWAGVDANAHRQRRAVLLAETGQRLLHGECGAQGLFGIILAVYVRPPQRHHRIADVLVNDAAPRSDLVIQHLPKRVHQLCDVLVVEGFAERGEAGDISEEDGDLFALGFRRARCTSNAANCWRRPDKRRIDNCIAKDSPLGFQGCDGVLKLGSFHNPLMEVIPIHHNNAQELCNRLYLS